MGEYTMVNFTRPATTTDMMEDVQFTVRLDQETRSLLMLNGSIFFFAWGGLF